MFISIFILIAMVILLFKNNNTYKNHIILLNAIAEHNYAAILEDRCDKCISYECIESYYKALFNLFDWGYKNLVPRDVYKRIDPFIDKENWKEMNNTTKVMILAYASEPDKDYNYDGDEVVYKGKRYWVCLRDETVRFLGIVKETE